MNNFDQVFFVVKEKCREQGSEKGADIGQIAQDLKMLPYDLQFYLEILVRIGLLQYSADRTHISITPRGEILNDMILK